MDNQEKNGDSRNLIIRGETVFAEKGALVCALFMLMLFLWNQFRYGMNMMIFIIPLTLMCLYLVIVCTVPEYYCFTESELEIRRRWGVIRRISYHSVFNLESSVHDSSINLLQGNKVKLYYLNNGRKTLSVCRPVDVETFTDILRERCAEFNEDTENNSRLEVFFKNN